jgi:hypothetical protein
VLAAIKKTGAQAVHPGYGFLSENSNFVKACQEAGIVFIGPGAEAMHALGDKIESKKLAKKIGVNTVPGKLGEVPTVEEAITVCKYPPSPTRGNKHKKKEENNSNEEKGIRIDRFVFFFFFLFNKREKSATQS